MFKITDIPQSIPFSVFKDIADETGANECLVAYVKDKDYYEVVIRHDGVNMAAAVAWLALEARDRASEPATRDADISTIGKRIGVMRVKQHMNAQELEDAIGAPEGSVFRWETGKAIPSSHYINCLAAALKCDPEWLLNGGLIMLTDKNENNIKKDFRLPKNAICAAQDTLSKLIINLDMIEEEPAKKLALVVKNAFAELYR